MRVGQQRGRGKERRIAASSWTSWRHTKWGRGKGALTLLSQPPPPRRNGVAYQSRNFVRVQQSGRHKGISRLCAYGEASVAFDYSSGKVTVRGNKVFFTFSSPSPCVASGTIPIESATRRKPVERYRAFVVFNGASKGTTMLADQQPAAHCLPDVGRCKAQFCRRTTKFLFRPAGGLAHNLCCAAQQN